MCLNCRSALPYLAGVGTHTGALGLITTLGARGCPSLEGVPGPAAPALPAPLGPAMPCCPPNCGAPPEPAGWPGCNGPLPPGASAAGWILLRASASAVCDEVGVAEAEPEGELEAPVEGDAVPEVESFFLDDLLPSLALESCSC
jgi:hypothetical protein